MGTFEEVRLGLSQAEAIENARIFLERERAVKGQGCPLTADIFPILKLLAQKDVRGAALKLFEADPLAAVTSRLAPEFFNETQVYNRKAARISLRAIQRFLADRFSGTRPIDAAGISRKAKVAVIGSGPVGLMTALFLGREGYAVTVFESSSFPGGSLAAFYPEFRLPAAVVNAVLTRCAAEGVEFKLNVLFPRTISADELFDEGGFSAVLLAAGASVPERLGIAGEDAAGVISASKMLFLARAMRAGREPYTTPVFIGGKVVVAGHDEMAFDAARTALRMGAAVTMVINGAETDIRVSGDLVREAAEEGVKFKTFSAPVSVKSEAGCAKALVCRHLDYRVDDAGRLTVVEHSDAEFELAADTIIVSHGTRANTKFLSEIPGLDLNLDGSVWLKPDSSYTSVRKIFAAGHVTRPGASLLEVLIDARRAASEITAYLNG